MLLPTTTPQSAVSIQLIRAACRLKQRRQITRHAMRRTQATTHATPAVGREKCKLVDLMAGQACHGHSSRRVRVAVVFLFAVTTNCQSKAWPDLFKRLNGPPQPLGHVRIGREAAHEFKRHVEFVARLLTKLGRRVGNGQEENGQRGDEKVVEQGLLAAIYVRCLVDVGEYANSILCDPDHHVCEFEIFHNGSGRVEHGPVDEDAHLVGAQVENNLETVYCARWGFDLNAAVWVRKLEGAWDASVPIEDLEVEKRDILLVDLVLHRHVGHRFPDL